MAEKEIGTVVKLQIPAGKASPAPPVGPALGAAGVNIMDFVKQFNDKTAQMGNTVIPVVITVYKDKSFEFITKEPPMAVLIKQAAKVEKGSGKPNRDKVAKLTKAQVEKFVKEDLTKEITDGVQTFQYQINSMTTTNGQAPFLSVNMYLGETEEYKEELALLIEEVLKQRIQGMKNEKGVYVTPAFPKLLYVLE